MASAQKIFKANLDKLRRITPAVAVKLQYVDESDVELCETRKGERNLKRTVKDRTLYYHSSYSAVKEAEEWFRKLDLSHTQVLYVYGVGLGYIYDAAKEWLAEDPSHYLVFLEDDMAVLKRLLQTERAGEMLDHRQVQVHYFQDLKEGNPMLEWVTWYFLGLHPDVQALDLYKRERAQMVNDLSRMILHTSVGKESLTAEMRRFGAAFFRNYYANLLQLPNSYRATDLFGKFYGTPAIICGAGPSLEKNFHILEQLRDKAMIFTGGSALNALSSRGFLPHFSGGIDPNMTQFERLMTNYAFEVPFIYRSRMNHKAFRTINGPALYVAGTGGYRVSQWFEEQLDLEGPIIDEGHNVINFLMSAARAFGCNPIILVGMDLAYTGMKSYATGVVEENAVSEQSILKSGDLESGAFPRPDINGEPVYTLWKWVGEANWIGNFAKENSDIQVINATEGGIGFPFVPNLSLKEVADTYLNTEYDLRTWVHGEIQNAKIQGLTEDKLFESLRTMYDSLWRCIELCEGMLEEAEQMRERITRGDEVPASLQSGKASSLDFDLTQELAYNWILTPLAVAPFKSMDRHMHQIKHDWNLESDADRNLAKLAVNQTKMHFLRDAARVNRMVIRVCTDEYLEQKGREPGLFVEEPGESDIETPEIVGEKV